MPTSAESYLLNVIQQIADQEPHTPQGKLARTALVQYATVYGDNCWNAREQNGDAPDYSKVTPLNRHSEGEPS